MPNPGQMQVGMVRHRKQRRGHARGAESGEDSEETLHSFEGRLYATVVSAGSVELFPGKGGDGS